MREVIVFIAQFSPQVVSFLSCVVLCVLALGAYVLGKKSMSFHAYILFVIVTVLTCVNTVLISGAMMTSGYARSEEFLTVGHEYVITGIVYEGVFGADIEVVLLNVTLHKRQIWSFQNLPPRCFIVRARYVYEAEPQCRKNTPPEHTDEKPNLRAEGFRMALGENGIPLEAVV